MIKRIKNRTICSLISRKSSCMKCYCHFVFLSFSFPSVRFSTPQFLLYFPYLRNSYCTFPYLRIYYCTLSLPPHFLLYFPCLRISYCIFLASAFPIVLYPYLRISCCIFSLSPIYCYTLIFSPKSLNNCI